MLIVIYEYRWVLLILAGAGFIAAAAALIKGRISTRKWNAARGIRPEHQHLTARPLITENEREFLGRLREAVPEMDIMTQVAMSALVDTSLAEKHPDYWKVRKLFSQKVVDYVLLQRSTQRPLAVIELDDRTHDAKKDRARDRILATVGIRTIRFDSRAKPSVDELRRHILQVLVAKDQSAR